MNKWIFFILGWCVMCFGREPFKPRDKSVPFLSYFLSHYRGICVGTLVSRTAVITAAVCIADPVFTFRDTRPVNVITGATYRHPRRGIRVQVTKILIPKLSNSTIERVFQIQKSPALLLLARKVPDVLTEIPMRPITVDYKGDEVISLHDECLILGWHFFYKGVILKSRTGKINIGVSSALMNDGQLPEEIDVAKNDVIYPVHKFLLQRNIRGQFVVIVKKSIFCNTLTLKFQNAMTNLGYLGQYEGAASICIRDPDKEAQACHGMYGAPLICHGKMIGMMMAPDAQWTNCTGYTNVIHLLKSDLISEFMQCISGLFHPEFEMNWGKFKLSMEYVDEDNNYDYLPELYDRVLYQSSSSSEET